MQAMPKASTDIFYQEGKRIQNQLENELDSKYNLHPDFRFQGSVTTNTHIKAVSDIDLLVLTEKFKSYEGELPSYCHKISHKTSIEYIEILRSACIKILKKQFPKADVKANSKSIKTVGGSLQKDIDVVPANWFITKAYNQSNNEADCGVQIFNSKTKDFNRNFPFKLIVLVNKKDKDSAGNYRKLVRLMKTIKIDLDDDNPIRDISSYDIQALVYNIPSKELAACSGLKLLQLANKYILQWISREDVFNTLKVPDKTRSIHERVSIDSLVALNEELNGLWEEIN